MNKARKKELLDKWRWEQRKEAFDALPLPIEELKAMFDKLDVELSRAGCDHSRRFTQAWLIERGHDVEKVFAWLDTQSGFCDCEVLANVEERVDDLDKHL